MSNPLQRFLEDRGQRCELSQDTGVGGLRRVPTSLRQRPGDWTPAVSVLSFTPPILFELQWAVRCQHV